MRLAVIPQAPSIFSKDVSLSPFGMRNKARFLPVALYSVCLLTLVSSFHLPASFAAAPIRVVTDLKAADRDFPEIAPPKLPSLPVIPKLPIDLHAESHHSENKYVLTLSVPTKLEDACHGLVANCQSAFNQVGKNAQGLGQWLDNLFKTNDLSQRRAPVYITPAVSEAAKYCSRFHVCYTHEGRIKTVAPQ